MKITITNVRAAQLLKPVNSIEKSIGSINWKILLALLLHSKKKKLDLDFLIMSSKPVLGILYFLKHAWFETRHVR